MRAKRAPLLLLPFLIFMTLSIPVNAQEILSPKSHFGFSIGDNYQLATYTQTEAYFKKIAAAPDRARYTVIGKTEEGRDQLMLIVSSPDNLKKLDHYKAISQQLAHAEGLTDEQAHALAAEGKAVVWIDGGLHATEVPLVPQRLIPSGATPNPVTPQKWYFRQSIDYSVSLNYAVLDYAVRYRDELLYNIYKMGRNSIERGRQDHWTISPKRIDEINRLAQRDSSHQPTRPSGPISSTFSSPRITPMTSPIPAARPSPHMTPPAGHSPIPWVCNSIASSNPSTAPSNASPMASCSRRLQPHRHPPSRWPSRAHRQPAPTGSTPGAMPPTPPSTIC